jgi:hypothetical protein
MRPEESLGLLAAYAELNLAVENVIEVYNKVNYIGGESMERINWDTNNPVEYDDDDE